MGSLGPALAAARPIWRAVTPPVARLLISIILGWNSHPQVSWAAARGAMARGSASASSRWASPSPRAAATIHGRRLSGRGRLVPAAGGPDHDRVGTASWYGELFHGRRTANGEIYDMDRLSAAPPTLPLQSMSE